MRLITHTDFDGLVSALLVCAMEDVHQIDFVDPQTIQGKFMKVTSDDIITDLPYDPRCGLWFDHHASNAPAPGAKFEGAHELKPSAARVIFDYYANEYLERFRPIVDDADRIDSGAVTMEEVLNPTGAYLFSLTLESRAKKKIDDDFKRQLLPLLRKQTLEQVMQHPLVQARIASTLSELKKYRELLPKHTRVEGNVAIVDIRNAQLPKGSNYLIYALNPGIDVSVKIFDDPTWENYVCLSVGCNNFKKSCLTDIGALMRKYGGGGHPVVGGCMLPKEGADAKIREIIEALKK